MMYYTSALARTYVWKTGEKGERQIYQDSIDDAAGASQLVSCVVVGGGCRRRQCSARHYHMAHFYLNLLST